MIDEKAVFTNASDENGNPSGGSIKGVGIDINWQDGPLGRGEDRVEPNGAFIETVMVGLIKRLEYFQDIKFRCRENAIALTKLEEALMWLQWRTKRRELEGNEGTHKGN